MVLTPCFNVSGKLPLSLVQKFFPVDLVTVQVIFGDFSVEIYIAVDVVCRSAELIASCRALVELDMR